MSRREPLLACGGSGQLVSVFFVRVFCFLLLLLLLVVGVGACQVQVQVNSVLGQR